MKIIKRIQILLFCCIIGFAGTWEMGEISDLGFAAEVLSVLVGILSLQLLKCKIESKKIKGRNNIRVYNNYRLTSGR